MRILAIIGLYFVAALALFVEARGPQKSFDSAGESVLVWSADTLIGPVYFPATAPVGSPTRQVAEDLARILGLAAGCEWAVKPEPTAGLTMNGIYVGDTVRARLDGVYGTLDGRPVTGLNQRELLDSCDWERTEVWAHPKRLVINGVTPEATRSGVYRFLQEDLGCLWAAPGSEGERIPQIERFALPAGRRFFQPVFYDRKFLLGGNLSPSHPIGLWALRNGASDHFTFNHNLHRIFTPKVMAEHPDWRAWRFGERAHLKDLDGSGSQPDLRHPEVIDFAAGYVREQMASRPDPLTIAVSTNDSIRYDDSDATRAWLQPWRYFRLKPNYSDLVFHFTDQVAAQTDVPGAPYITQLAYMWAERPPGFAVDPRVMPYLCSDQSQWYDPAYRADDQALIADWSEAGPRMLGVWEYYQGQPYIIPRYFPSIMADSMQWMTDHRVRGAFFSGKPQWGYDAPKYWLAGQLGWRPDADHTQLLDGYFAQTYGAAAAAMAAFFAECEDAWMTQPGSGLWLKYFYNPDQLALFSPARRQRMTQRLEDAQALADDLQSRGRIAQTRAAWEVTRRAADLYDAYRAIPYPGQGRTPVDAQWAAFDTAMEAWREVDKTPFDLSKPVLRMLDGFNPAARWRDGYHTLVLEDFRTPVFVGDLEGAGPETLAPSHFLNQWSVLFSHAEGVSVRRRLDPAPHLEIQGADYFRLTRRYGLEGVLDGRFRVTARVSGQVSPGCEVSLQLFWIDDRNRMIQPLGVDRLAPGVYPEPVLLAAELPASPQALSLGVNVMVLNQFPGDELSIEALELQFQALGSAAE